MVGKFCGKKIENQFFYNFSDIQRVMLTVPVEQQTNGCTRPYLFVLLKLLPNEVAHFINLF